MKLRKLISDLEYWARIAEEENPEVVITIDGDSYEIADLTPALGIDENQAIGISFYE